MKDPYECLPSLREIERYFGPGQQETVSQFYRDTRRGVLINCWHINDYESAAMWKLYLKSEEGVAIQSTFATLRDSFTPADAPVYIGQVEYLDAERETGKFGNAFYSFLRKRRNFEHEHELRALLFGDPAYFEVPKGVYVSVDVQRLIKKVFVSPVADDWFHDVVRSVAGKYGVEESRVVQSDLYRLTYPS